MSLVYGSNIITNTSLTLSQAVFSWEGVGIFRAAGSLQVLPDPSIEALYGIDDACLLFGVAFTRRSLEWHGVLLTALLLENTRHVDTAPPAFLATTDIAALRLSTIRLLKFYFLSLFQLYFSLSTV